MKSNRKRSGRPITGKAKTKISIRLPQELIKKIDEIGDRTSVITKIIAEYLEKNF
jgi:metal-responsive CopG/Arc/MetJ family transcriptional regulator